MIVKNEQSLLPRCLTSAQGIYDELIIVDTGSTDNTIRIARKFTRHVHRFKWIDNFAAARNASFSYASGDYLMWLDADDVIEPPMRDLIIALKQTLGTPEYAPEIVAMRYSLGKDFYSTRGRLFKRSCAHRWVDEIHEHIPLIGDVHVRPDIYITHKPNISNSSPFIKGGDASASGVFSKRDRNLRIYERILARDGALSPRGKYYYARELREHGRLAESAKYFELFLNENLGWVEDNIAACFNLSAVQTSLNKPDLALSTLFRSFEYDAPRAEILCMIAYHYMPTDPARAALWFETALNLPKRESLGFVLADFHTFIPALELAVCHDRLGNPSRAQHFNNLAGTIHPTHPSYLQNKEYFSNKLFPLS